MTNYHLNSVRNALREVWFSGEPCEISSAYTDRFPIGITLEGLAREFDLTVKICKSSGRAIIEKPFRSNA